MLKNILAVVAMMFALVACGEKESVEAAAVEAPAAEAAVEAPAAEAAAVEAPAEQAAQ
jgi:predicted small lipoprotein YifL